MAEGTTAKPVMVILPDNTAICFMASEIIAREPEPEKPAPSTRGERLTAFLKSFLPQVSRVTPVNAQLPSGRNIKMMAPPATVH